MNLTAIDLDIEGGALGNTTANDRRNQALAQLQTEYRAAGKTLSVDYTLPTDPSGLPGEAISLVAPDEERYLARLHVVHDQRRLRLAVHVEPRLVPAHLDPDRRPRVRHEIDVRLVTARCLLAQPVPWPRWM